jgi:hypothetical protein
VSARHDLQNKVHGSTAEAQARTTCAGKGQASRQAGKQASNLTNSSKQASNSSNSSKQANKQSGQLTHKVGNMN